VHESSEVFTVVLYVGDDWAEDHHDVEVMDAEGRTLARARLDEGLAGMARLHALVGKFLDPVDEGTQEARTVSRWSWSGSRPSGEPGSRR
jgi:hypothetical protein